jgi:hypothetical protein
MRFSKLFQAAFILIIAVSLSSCVKKDFDSPPSTNVDPEITANRTIAQLKTLANSFGDIVPITDDIIISGIINSDDRSGNIYKTIIFQDSTAGILINVDLNSFYSLFPKGRKIFVKCKGLYIAEVHGVVQLGVLDNSGNQSTLGRIPPSLIDTYIFRGVWGQTVTSKVVTMDSITDYNQRFENMLITINNIEFTLSDAGKPYADAVLQNSLARFIADCNGDSIEVYTSGFATFASTLTPAGNGSITAVYLAYNTTPELIISDVEDVNMNGLRCGQDTSTSSAGDTLTALNQTFSGVSVDDDIQLTGWKNIAVTGNRNWIGKSFSGNFYAQNSAFGSGLPAMESWLITPRLDLSVADTLTFQSAMAFFVSNQLSVWISTNFNGTNVAAATWTQLACTLATSSSGNYTFVNSGNVPLTSFNGIGVIGFKYVGDGTTNTTTFKVDNVAVH